MTAPAGEWERDNQLRLAAAIGRVRRAVERFAGDPPDPPEPPVFSETDPRGDSRLDDLVDAFSLSPFERDVVLLCAGMELDPALMAAVRRLQLDGHAQSVTFSLALAALPGAYWSALAPEAPLRYWRLVDVAPGHSLTLAPLRIDERILQFLTGLPSIDERLAELVRFTRPETNLPESHAAIAHSMAAAWTLPAGGGLPPLVQLCGEWSGTKRGIAAAACAASGWELWTMNARQMPPRQDSPLLRRLWERESILEMRALLIECDDAEPTHADLAAFVESTTGPVAVASLHRGAWTRPAVAFDVERPPAAEMRQIWIDALGPQAHEAAPCIDRLVYQFALDARAIRAVCAETAQAPAPRSCATLWDACRRAARPRVENGVHRIDSHARWDQLVLPPRQLDLLREIVAHVERRAEVYGQWGFGEAGERGLGITALFAGQSGTGKTLAAEVLAGELRLDLYRIDLSAIVNKYIGETEKNLRRVFDAAEAGGAILLFDEADALFGKRGEVKDSHDRYANIEVSYLLQRMEAYRGLAILTTNLKDNLDQAFLRRLRFVVQFPFPDAALRAELWRRAFPGRTPVEGLDIDKLARLNATGAEIRNIALHAAFLASGEGTAVTMKHLRRAAIGEFAKAEKGLAEADTRGWV